MMIQSQLLLSPLNKPMPLPPHPHPQPLLPLNKLLPLPLNRESRMMIQMMLHPHPQSLLFLATLLHPQEDAVKSLMRVPPKLFYGLSYDIRSDVCRFPIFFCKKYFLVLHVVKMW